MHTYIYPYHPGVLISGVYFIVNYFVTFINGYTHDTVTYLMNSKSEVFKTFKDNVSKSQAYKSSIVVYLYCDNDNANYDW